MNPSPRRSLPAQTLREAQAFTRKEKDMPLQVCVVEDDDKVRESLATLIGASRGFACRAAYPDAETALEGIPSQNPDVVLMDINLPRMSGVECVRRLKVLAPKLQVVMLTVYDDDDQIFKALEAGANGYLLKRSSPAELLSAISDVHNGGVPMSSTIARRVLQTFHQRGASNRETENLSQREIEVLGLLAKGFLYKEIADQMAIRFETVHSHVRNIYDKLQVRSRTEAVAKYLGHK